MFDFYNKHYIRLDGNIVIKGFSDAFETPLESDICINEKGGRHFELNGEINPSLFDENFCHLYRYENNEIRLATVEELEAEYEANYVEPAPTEMELLWQTVTDLEISLLETQIGGINNADKEDWDK